MLDQIAASFGIMIYQFDLRAYSKLLYQHDTNMTEALSKSGPAGPLRQDAHGAATWPGNTSYK